MGIKLPIQVDKIEFDEAEVYENKDLFGNTKCGQMVMVRPCNEKFKNKTFLGVFIGNVALMQGVEFDHKTGTLKVVRSMYNPMIFIPECNDVVFGCGSWWGKIDSEEQLKQITNDDIQNVWYVKALKQIGEKQKESDDGTA